MKNITEPRILQGFMELLPEDQILFNKMYDTIKKVYEKFGYLPLDTPTIEYSDVLLAKAGGETEKQIYRFTKGDNDLSLRFDLTVPLARYVALHYNDLTFPFKRYQMSKVFRGERPQKGRFREFYQCDIDVIGSESLDTMYDAEIPAVIYNVFKELNIGKFTIRINNRKILNGFFQSINLTDKISDILRIIDKIEKIGEETVKEELKNLNIDSNLATKIIKFIKIKDQNEVIINELKNLDINNDLFLEGIEELEIVINNLKNFNVNDNYYQIDLTIARGLDYYTGTVYETKLDDYPSLGSICSGGRYDDLAGYYTNQILPGVGISIGLTRLFAQLKEAGIIKNQSKSLTKVLIIPMDKSNLSFSLNIASKFREKNINADTFYTDKGLKQKIKYADKLGINYIGIIGEDEENNNNISLKNLSNGQQQTISINEAIKIIEEG